MGSNSRARLPDAPHYFDDFSPPSGFAIGSPSPVNNNFIGSRPSKWLVGQLDTIIGRPSVRSYPLNVDSIHIVYIYIFTANRIGSIAFFGFVLQQQKNLLLIIYGN